MNPGRPARSPVTTLTELSYNESAMVISVWKVSETVQTCIWPHTMNSIKQVFIHVLDYTQVKTLGRV